MPPSGVSVADEIDAFLDGGGNGGDEIDAFLDASPMRDAVSSFGTPPPNDNFEVGGRSQPVMGRPTFAPGIVDPGEGVNVTRALLTNQPTQGFTEGVIRAAPAAIGSMVGGAAGAGIGSIPLAGLGGAAGESARQGLVNINAARTGGPFTAPGEVLTRVGAEGAANALGQGVGLGIGAAASAARPAFNKLGAQVMRVGAGVPEKYGEAVMRNPGMLLDAPTPEAASQAYKSFEAKTGLTGLMDQIRLTGKAPSEGELEKALFEVAARARNGVSSSPQELYHASQAASNLNSMGKLGNPRYATLKAAISEAKGVVDDALEAVIPEYKQLRSDYFASKTAQQFSSYLPLNQNTSPNVLRGVTAATTAGAGLMSGNPAALAALPLVSPKFYGTGLKAAAVAGQIPVQIPQAIYRVGTSAGGSALADAYMRQPAR